MLRIPGTSNIPNEKKKALGRKKSEVTLFKSEGPRYRLDKLEAIAQSAILPAPFLNHLRTDARLKTTWEGTRDDLRDQSRSGYDMAMANQLLRRGLSDQAIKDILQMMPSGRGAEATDAYLKRTIQKAREWNLVCGTALGNLKDRPPYIAEAFLRETGLVQGNKLGLRWYREDWWEYDGRIFRKVPTADFHARIAAYVRSGSAKKRCTISFVNNVALNLQALCHLDSQIQLPIEQGEQGLIHRPNCLVLHNGILDVNDLSQDLTILSLRKHSPSFISQVCLPFDFDPNATCPLWKTFLKEVLPNLSSRKLLQEILGYCLLYDTSQQKFFLFEGEGGNGKGVVQFVVMKLVGEGNYSTVPLESFGETHGLETTLGKLVNIIGDVNEIDKVAEGRLKQYTGEDPMHFNPKYKTPFSAIPTARLIISANVRPSFRDRSQGTWRRLIVLPFPIAIPEDKQDRQLKEKLLRELSGIFLWALRGLQRLRANGAFTIPKASAKALREYQREANPARMFLEEWVEENDDGSIAVTKLYRNYSLFCKDHGYRPLTDANFGKEVPKTFPQMLKKRATRTWHGFRPWVYQGIRLKPEYQKTFPQNNLS